MLQEVSGYYITRKIGGRAKAELAVRLLRDLFQSVAPDTRILDQSIDAAMDDFEDAIQFFSALRIGADYLLTGNTDHFPETGPKILTPSEFLAIRALG